ncbi:MAG TPA: ABC transporter ATP-binding protein [Candidatus Saccharimonadales bacterium]|nr:ABC transporter ATP-binding protein [Candidatus Saccharimonadales bacterium]
MASDVALVTQNLGKSYPGTDVWALKDLNLSVKAGEVYGFLGPNGAGKSTTIRTLLNFIQPSSGTGTILGLDIVADSVKLKRYIGYQAGEVALYKHLTGQQFLDYMAKLQPIKHANYFKELVFTFQAELDKPIATLSKGNRQKLGVIQAFMHEPEVLILDEPTAGLDPLMQTVFFRLVEESRARGAAIFLSSHDLAEVQKMCDRIGFIRGGRLIAEQTIADLHKVAAHNFDITFGGDPPIAEIKKIRGAKVTVLNRHSLSVKLQGELTPLLKVLARHSVVSLYQHELNLEEEFLKFYRT